MKTAIDLDEAHAARILDGAVRCHAGLAVEIAGEADLALSGHFVSADESVLVLALSHPPPAGSRTLIGRYVTVQVFADEHYSFSTHVVDQGGPHEPGQLVLHRPEFIQKVQRRRLWRARLAPSSTVDLAWKASNRRRRVSAVLLNLSPDGLACRLSAECADDFAPGRRLEVSFGVPGGSERFHFRAAVRNVTPVLGQAVILGLQFEPDNGEASFSDMQQKLSDCLYERADERCAAGTAP